MGTTKLQVRNRAIAEASSRQHGVITRAEAEELGVTRSAVKSVFRWEPADAGDTTRPAAKLRVVEEPEVLLVIKTSRARVAELEKRLLELHPYQCPELIRIEPEHVEEKYLAWLVAACDGTRGS